MAKHYEVRVIVMETEFEGEEKSDVGIILSKEIVTFDILGNAITFAQKVWRRFAER